MTAPPHDCNARLNQLQATIEKNKDKLVDQQSELERSKESSQEQK